MKFEIDFQTPEEREKRKTEQKKFGIFFDDEYDYLQHLRTRDENNTVHWEYIPPSNVKNRSNDEKSDAPKELSVGFTLPSSVFASEFEEEEGLLRKAAPHLGPRPDLEPEIVAALDDEFDFDSADNELEDNFMELAMGGEGDGNCIDYEDEDGEYSDIESDFEGDDQLAPLRQPHQKFSQFDDEEIKSRFTEYSMSSSVLRRNEQLTLLDDRFEKFYENYDEPEIGAMDCEEIEGNVEMSGDLLNQCMVELKRDPNDLPYDKEWDKERIRKMLAEESSEEEMVELEVTDSEFDRKWDCESVLSTYSNAYNHPKVINEPRSRKHSKIVINPKTGVPMNVLNGDSSQLTLKSIAKFNTENT